MTPERLDMARNSLASYWDLLNSHDWYYCFSDDGGVYNAGRRAHAVMDELANTSQEHRALFIAFSDHMFTGRPWGNEKQPKPERPENWVKRF